MRRGASGGIDVIIEDMLLFLALVLMDIYAGYRIANSNSPAWKVMTGYAVYKLLVTIPACLLFQCCGVFLFVWIVAGSSFAVGGGVQHRVLRDDDPPVGLMDLLRRIFSGESASVDYSKNPCWKESLAKSLLAGELAMIIAAAVSLLMWFLLFPAIGFKLPV